MDNEDFMSEEEVHSILRGVCGEDLFKQDVVIRELEYRRQNMYEAKIALCGKIEELDSIISYIKSLTELSDD